jgi:hypothetical protein
MNDISNLALPDPASANGVTPLGSMYLAIANKWHDKEQEKANRFFEEWVRMLQDEMREKEATILEIMARLDLQNESIAERVSSREFQSLVRKTFGDWSGAESEEKRVWIRNILANAAAGRTTSDDVVRMFINWIGQYSELHFQVIANIYQTHGRGTSRGLIWRSLGRPAVREDSADADLYRLLFRDLSMGGIIRQHREVNYAGEFVAKQPAKKSSPGSAKTMVSAFDTQEEYELTDLGSQFVHYAMTDLPLKVDYSYMPEPSGQSGEGR